MRWRPGYVLAILAISALSTSSLMAQEPSLSPPAKYNLSGDNLLIENDESGGRHVRAEGNVHLVYVLGDDVWQLSAGTVDYVESTVQTEIIAQEATASGDVEISGPGITVSTPGAIDVDFLQRNLRSSTGRTTAVLRNSEITTDNLEIVQNESPSGETELTVKTSGYTNATYTLNQGTQASTRSQGVTSGGIFGSLDFDLSRISIETRRTILLVRNGEPVRLDCPDQSVITSSTNKFTLPSCSIDFNPTVLTGGDGVEIEVAGSALVKAGSFRFGYPPEGGMFMELSCSPSAPSGQLGDQVDPSMCLPDRVTITQGDAVFYADSILLSVKPDGSRRIEARGGTRLEIAVSDLMGESGSSGG